MQRSPFLEHTVSVSHLPVKDQSSFCTHARPSQHQSRRPHGWSKSTQPLGDIIERTSFLFPLSFLSISRSVFIMIFCSSPEANEVVSATKSITTTVVVFIICFYLYIIVSPTFFGWKSDILSWPLSHIYSPTNYLLTWQFLTGSRIFTLKILSAGLRFFRNVQLKLRLQMLHVWSGLLLLNLLLLFFFIKYFCAVLLKKKKLSFCFLNSRSLHNKYWKNLFMWWDIIGIVD